MPLQPLKKKKRVRGKPKGLGQCALGRASCPGGWGFAFLFSFPPLLLSAEEEEISGKGCLAKGSS